MAQGEESSMMSSRNQEVSRTFVNDTYGLRLSERENLVVLGNLAAGAIKDTSLVQSSTLVAVIRSVSIGYPSIGGGSLRRSTRFRKSDSNNDGFRGQIADPRNTDAYPNDAIGVVGNPLETPVVQHSPHFSGNCKSCTAPKQFYDHDDALIGLSGDLQQRARSSSVSERLLENAFIRGQRI